MDFSCRQQDGEAPNWEDITINIKDKEVLWSEKKERKEVMLHQ